MDKCSLYMHVNVCVKLLRHVLYAYHGVVKFYRRKTTSHEWTPRIALHWCKPSEKSSIRQLNHYGHPLTALRGFQLHDVTFGNVLER